MIISIDYDKCLSDKRIQTLVKRMVIERNEVWVITKRSDNDYCRNELKPVLDKVRLTFGNVIFCGNRPKLEMIQMVNADIYIDNISNEFQDILNHTNTIPLLLNL